MVTGVETAGLVLGSIPLILAGLEFYGKGIAVSKRYWKYREGIKGLAVELKCESTMCLNSINMLLIGVVKPREMADFLKDPRGTRWKDAKFEKKLKDRLGTTYESYIDTIESMDAAVSKFLQRLKLDGSGKPQFYDHSAFKEHYKRLCFSLKKSDYDDVMQSIRAANLGLYRMTTQTISLGNLNSANAKSYRQTMPKFNVIHDRAQGFYSALSSGWKCPCHADHSVNLRLESRMEDMPSDDESDSDNENMRDPFHVLFRYSHSHSGLSSPPAASPWIWEEAEVRIKLQQTLSPQPQPCPAGGTKGVRFAAQAKKAVKAALDPHPNLQPIQNLCAAISALQKPQRDVCLPFLIEEYAKQKYGILIYPHQDPPMNPESWNDGSIDSGDASVDLRTQWNTADRIVDDLYSEAGDKFSDAVRRCIRCNFDCRASNLHDEAFQKEVFERVVSQLKENFDFLHPSIG
ncbi:hypothetical protein BU16DRAFT_515854 [Lophium mytilinum]|uniref:DUF7580 domain-containing protein n=1 Tax=Lophium mytilinum TaxID=390894 RepID=A0A6A6QGE1_9PEZI|nr:hypothetical protein BU16DRAFT_515854 [Lophium mytilinum]